jgi:hypothetical protein
MLRSRCMLSPPPTSCMVCSLCVWQWQVDGRNGLWKDDGKFEQTVGTSDEYVCSGSKEMWRWSGDHWMDLRWVLGYICWCASGLRVWPRETELILLHHFYSLSSLGASPVWPVFWSSYLTSYENVEKALAGRKLLEGATSSEKKVRKFSIFVSGEEIPGWSLVLGANILLIDIFVTRSLLRNSWGKVREIWRKWHSIHLEP